jgi:hypothetical protein
VITTRRVRAGKAQNRRVENGGVYKVPQQTGVLLRQTQQEQPNFIIVTMQAQHS